MDILYLFCTRDAIPAFRTLVWKSTEDKKSLYLQKFREELERRGIDTSATDIELSQLAKHLNFQMDDLHSYDLTDAFLILEEILIGISESQ